MLDAFYQHLAIPDSCLLEKRLFKKQFYANAPVNATDKKAFVEDIDNIEWRYTLKPDTINVQRFEDENREYLEVAILQVMLSSGKRYQRIAEVMQKAIPYPLLILFVWETDKAAQASMNLALHLADKRINRADSNKIVVEASYDSGWIDMSHVESWQADFLADFRATNFPWQNFYVFYQAMVTRLIALNCARHTGGYVLELNDSARKTDRLEALRQIDKLLLESTELRNKLKKEKNMGTQVQLNMRVRQIAGRIEEITSKL